MKFQSKTVLITGASSGIGKDFALRVAEDGAHIYLASRSIDKLESVKAEVEKVGGTAEVIACDVTRVDQIKSMFLHIAKSGRTLDLVLNNAGLGHIGKIYQLSTEQIQSVIDVNITGMIMVSKYATEVFTRQKHGHLIMVSSLAGLVTLPEWSIYVASKWAITGFADCIRPELEPHGVLVSTVHPGPVKTEFFDADKANIDISKMGEAIEVRDLSNAIHKLAFTKKQRLLIPALTRNFALMYRFFPGITKGMINNLAAKAEYHSDIKEDEPDFDFIQPVTS